MVIQYVFWQPEGYFTIQIQLYFDRNRNTKYIFKTDENAIFPSGA